MFVCKVHIPNHVIGEEFENENPVLELKGFFIVSLNHVPLVRVLCQIEPINCKRFSVLRTNKIVGIYKLIN